VSPQQHGSYLSIIQKFKFISFVYLCVGDFVCMYVLLIATISDCGPLPMRMLMPQRERKRQSGATVRIPNA